MYRNAWRLFGLMILAVSAMTHADVNYDKFVLVGKENPTAVSGYAGAWEELGNTGDYRTLKLIAWGEKTDDPCGLFIDTGHINNFSPVINKYDMPKKPDVNPFVFGKFEIKTSSLEPYFDASGNLQHAKYVKLDCGGDLKAVASMANDKHVYKINACTTDKRDSADNKLKGIRVWSRTLAYKNYQDGQDPELIDEPTPQESLHKPHCEKWHTPAACGPGEVATRLRVHHNDSGHRDWITGLSLVCRKVKLKEQLGFEPGQLEPEKVPAGSFSPKTTAPMR